MKRRALSRKRWMWLGVGTVALVAAIALGVTVATPRSAASQDGVTLDKLIRDYQAAQLHAGNISPGALAAVEAARDKLLADPDRSPVDSGAPPIDVLPAAERERMNCEDAAYKAAYLTESAQQRCEGEGAESIADVVALGIYNNPEAPLVVKGEERVLADQVMTDDGSTAVVWAYTWAGDVTEKGNGAQNWPILEYPLVKEDGQWRIDDVRELGILFPTSDGSRASAASSAWGPFSPHSSVAYMEDGGPSQLHPSEERAPLGPLQELEAKALAVVQ